MSSLCALSIVTAALCGIWSYLAGIAGLIGWAGFAGCTTYFACGKHGMSGVKKTMITNLTGVLCGRSSHLARSIRYSGILESGAGSLHS